MERAVVSWSTGKDSAWALHEARRDFEVAGLLTTLSDFRVSMHGVREELLDAQAHALGLPVIKVPLPTPCPNDAYESAMTQALSRVRALGATRIVFGDLFLRDVRDYRDSKLAGTGFSGAWPLWGRDTRELAQGLIHAGVRAKIVCLDPRRLPRDFIGGEFDPTRLPAGVDPCAENGEFHTFVWDGPMFREPVGVRVEGTFERDGFVYADVRSA